MHGIAGVGKTGGDCFRSRYVFAGFAFATLSEIRPFIRNRWNLTAHSSSAFLFPFFKNYKFESPLQSSMSLFWKYPRLILVCPNSIVWAWPIDTISKWINIPPIPKDQIQTLLRIETEKAACEASALHPPGHAFSFHKALMPHCSRVETKCSLM
jgi:hypothetical protein